jgi:uncharacterized membrane protein
MMENPMIAQSKSTKARVLKNGTFTFTRHWLAWFNLGWSIIFGLPWLAPVFMTLGVKNAARVIYILFGFLCHQFADRSFFLFGNQVMYPSAQLLALSRQGDPRIAMRYFVGSETLGYKVAWSDRMVAIYGGILLGGLLFALLRKLLTGPKLWIPVLLLIPMGIDGSTHVLSDMAGFNVGFRYTNTWLVTLTQHRLRDAFYVGNALGSFNSYARLISGLLSGFALVLAAYPILEVYFEDVKRTLSDQLQIRKPADQERVKKIEHVQERI